MAVDVAPPGPRSIQLDPITGTETTSVTLIARFAEPVAPPPKPRPKKPKPEPRHGVFWFGR